MILCREAVAQIFLAAVGLKWQQMKYVRKLSDWQPERGNQRMMEKTEQSVKLSAHFDTDCLVLFELVNESSHTPPK